MTARGEGRIEEAQAFDAVSGFAAFRAALQDQVRTRGRLLRYGSAVRLAGGMLDRAVAGVEARRLAIADDDASRAAGRRQRASVAAALGDDAPWRAAVRGAVAELRSVLERDAAHRIQSRLEWAYGDPVERGQMTDVNALLRDLDRELVALHAVLRRRYLTALTRMVRALQTTLGAEGLTGLINDLAPPDDLREALPGVQSASPFEGIDRDLLVSAGTAGISVARVLATGLATGLTGAAEIGGASPVVATTGAATGSAAASTAAGGTAALALGPALVIGAFVGATVLGVRAYDRYKAAQVERAGDAVERAVVAAKEILGEFLVQADALATDAVTLVQLRLTERDRELDRGQVRRDAHRRTGIVELDEISADLDRFQDERVRLREAVAARLVD
jgi:hypothetical protein